MDDHCDKSDQEKCIDTYQGPCRAASMRKLTQKETEVSIILPLIGESSVTSAHKRVVSSKVETNNQSCTMKNGSASSTLSSNDKVSKESNSSSDSVRIQKSTKIQPDQGEGTRNSDENTNVVLRSTAMRTNQDASEIHFDNKTNAKAHRATWTIQLAIQRWMTYEEPPSPYAKLHLGL